MKKIPLSFAWLYLLISGYALMIVCLPFCPSIQRMMMEKFHLRSPSFAQWSMLQFAPSMYNFSNQIWITETEISPRELLAPSDHTQIINHIWTNHYPFWPVTFFSRAEFFNPPQNYYITLLTRFQKQELSTIYHMSPTGLWERVRLP